ncbi:MAG: iron-siderophore ABC transporter substrate-binding protein [Pseudonocardia sp.]|nr:iron-siderophore ABC transporter substrate-binding protein [Pseudonocardia sp.]
MIPKESMMRRRSLLALLGAGLAGCAAPAVRARPPNATAPEGGGFPVTITHRFGTTTIPAPPRRVVAIGDQDATYAVGVTPVGIVRSPQYPGGVEPWLAGRLDPARTRLIDVAQGGEGGGSAVNLEQVAALAPDLILAVNDFGLEQDYPGLSRLAPTVGYATVWGGQPWQEQTAVVARALGLADRGRQVVADVETRIRAVRDAHPALVGRTVSFSYAYAPGKIVTLKSAADPAVRLLQDLGMRIPDALAALPDIAPGNPGGDLSYERIGLLDAEVVIMLYADDAARRQVEDLQLFQNLRGVREGRYAVLDLPTISALRSPTVLSIPWALERIDPDLDRIAR